MAFYEFEGKKPVVSKNSHVHPEATLIGDVTIEEGCYIGAGARLRGDWGAIVVSAGSNVQENCVIHVLPGETAMLGPRSHIGHGAVLHTPKLGEHVLVGMDAIIMDFATIGDGCLIGAGALVPEKMDIPPGKLAVGVPAKVVADISDEMREHLDYATGCYQALVPRYQNSLKQVSYEDCLKKD
ncbi:MAG: 2,3,4,5-tetrahydropyridine-2,6-dicarboxylate N-acetyltransferase [Pelotomaculum sp. PtaU1.Bin035]|nr:MAG: 2,3,4,5-tetrahydropyridine-2,6-dicarboxylate N-acetyltransferase [Pelotomaculum sp. PtaU1.Bin035]